VTGRVPEEMIGLHVPLRAVLAALNRHPDVMIARRLRPMRRVESRFRPTGELTVCALDVETTGLDRRNDRIIELAIQRARIDQHGRIVETGRPRSWFEDPGIPIPQKVTEKTGLTDADVAGRAISDGEAYGIISSADVVLSHNAAFDRPFVDRRLGLSGQAWICSLNDFDWEAHGFESRKLSELLLRCGWFYKAHRAEVDVTALLHLVDHRLDEGGTVMRELLRTAARPTIEIDAAGAPFAAKDELKARGYRWDADRRCWTTVIRDGSAEAERAWLETAVYAGAGSGPSVREVTWRERYTLD
jgi:DNA polymerase III subunit epsilon